MRVYALYDFGELVELYLDPGVAESDAEALRTQAKERHAGETRWSAEEFNHYIKVHEIPVRDTPRFSQ